MDDRDPNVIPAAVSTQFLTDKGSGINLAGSVIANVLGQGLKVKAGAAGKLIQNLGPMVAGALHVLSPVIAAGSSVLVMHRGDGGHVGFVNETQATRVAGVSFDVASTNGADVGHVDVLIVDPA